MFYIHPWEVDPGQPKIDRVSLKTRFRHYVGLNRTESKLKKLLQSNSFGPLKEFVNEPLADETGDAHSNSGRTSGNSLAVQR